MASLSDKMEFDHVIQVLENGTAISSDGISSPDEVWFDPSVNGDVDCGEGWTPMVGHSVHIGSACFHPSEFIGEGLSNYILSEPGFYVSVIVRDIDSEEGSDDIVGWAILHKPSS